MPPTSKLVLRCDHTGFVLLAEENSVVFAADPEGRIALIHTPDASYKRSRYNRWYRVVRDPFPALEETDEALRRIPEWERIWRLALAAIEESRENAASMRRILNDWIARFAEFHEEDARRFAALLPAISILPPDAYQSLYVRVQIGCPWNRCSFCTFYKDTHHRTVAADELELQARSLREYWGGALRSRHGIFLGDANAVSVPVHILEERLLALRRAFPEPELKEIHSFVDYFSGTRRGREELQRLKACGLNRLSLGVESGDTDLMDLLGKPFEPPELEQFVGAAQEAGIAMNLIFLLGPGGRQTRLRHRDHSLSLIERLRLRRHDRVFLSPLVVEPQQPYAAIGRAEGWEPMEDAELREELQAWQSALRGRTAAQVSPYHIRQFLY